ncbi:MAG: ADP-forming succinate--CoA ligase subunit beta [Dehalococcoidia bacterium]
MKLHEYQAKELLAQYGVPVPRGHVAQTPQEAAQAARALEGRAVVKAQVHAGGRGKAGGIKVVGSPEGAQEAAASLLGRSLATLQTGPQGAPVHRVLVEEPVALQQELYLAMVIDRAFQGPMMIASQAGGMEIEEVAARFPDRIHQEGVDLAVGFRSFQGRRLAYALGLPGELVQPASQLMGNLYRLFVEKDCSLVEINPLALTQEGALLAVDAKVSVEDDALYRHPELQALRDPEQEDPYEREANAHGIAYVKLGGDVGCLVNGAGLAMATLDLIKVADAEPANFLDVGGGADQERVARAVSIMLSDPQVRRVLVNVFGGILRCDVVARGILDAVQQQGASLSWVVRMLGTNVEEGKRLLGESGLRVQFAETLAEAATKVAQAI